MYEAFTWTPLRAHISFSGNLWAAAITSNVCPRFLSRETGPCGAGGKKRHIQWVGLMKCSCRKLGSQSLRLSGGHNDPRDLSSATNRSRRATVRFPGEERRWMIVEAQRDSSSPFFSVPLVLTSSLRVLLLPFAKCFIFSVKNSHILLTLLSFFFFFLIFFFIIALCFSAHLSLSNPLVSISPLQKSSV